MPRSGVAGRSCPKTGFDELDECYMISELWFEIECVILRSSITVINDELHLF